MERTGDEQLYFFAGKKSFEPPPFLVVTMWSPGPNFESASDQWSLAFVVYEGLSWYSWVDFEPPTS